MAKEPPLLHIYGQAAHHDDVHIVGTRAGLLRLLDAINVALSGGPGQHHPVFAADGEGYAIRVTVESEEGMADYVSPYHAPWAHDPAEDHSAEWPRKADAEER